LVFLLKHRSAVFALFRQQGPLSVLERRTTPLAAIFAEAELNFEAVKLPPPRLLKSNPPRIACPVVGFVSRTPLVGLTMLMFDTRRTVALPACAVTNVAVTVFTSVSVTVSGKINLPV